jgi:hypothetical protein
MDKNEQILSLVKFKAMNIFEICDAVHIVRRAMQDRLNHLMETNQLYVSHYKFEKLGKKFQQIKYYRAGNKPHAQKPAPLTDAEKQRLSRERLDENERENKLAKRRIKRYVSKIEKFGDPYTDWIRKP